MSKKREPLRVWKNLAPPGSGSFIPDTRPYEVQRKEELLNRTVQLVTGPPLVLEHVVNKLTELFYPFAESLPVDLPTVFLSSGTVSAIHHYIGLARPVVTHPNTYHPSERVRTTYDKLADWFDVALMGKRPTRTGTNRYIIFPSHQLAQLIMPEKLAERAEVIILRA